MSSRVPLFGDGSLFFTNSDVRYAGTPNCSHASSTDTGARRPPNQLQTTAWTWACREACSWSTMKFVWRRSRGNRPSPRDADTWCVCVCVCVWGVATTMIGMIGCNGGVGPRYESALCRTPLRYMPYYVRVLRASTVYSRTHTHTHTRTTQHAAEGTMAPSPLTSESDPGTNTCWWHPSGNGQRKMCSK